MARKQTFAPEVEAKLSVLQQCAALCDETAQTSARMGAEDLRRVSYLARECWHVCNLDIEFLRRSALLQTHVCTVTAFAADAVATECDEVAPLHGGQLRDLLIRTAAVCRQAADQCRSRNAKHAEMRRDQNER